jgi:hypothetical protein
VLWKLHGSFQNKMELVASNETLWHLRTGLHRADRHWLGVVWEGGDGVRGEVRAVRAVRLWCLWTEADRGG